MRVIPRSSGKSMSWSDERVACIILTILLSEFAIMDTSGREYSGAGEANKLSQPRRACSMIQRYETFRATELLLTRRRCCYRSAGFVAAIYHRSIEWIAVPTSLLGMVDAAIGGKRC
jgi:hypothetical protein